MRPLAAVERFFEQIFERPTARLFHTRLQPVQLQRRVERAMESERLTSAERTLVPNRYAIYLSPEDFESFADFATSLAAELADGALTYARSHRYSLVDRPQVQLILDEDVAPGDLRIATGFVDRPVEARTGTQTGGPSAVGEGGGEPGATQTMVFQVPEVRSPKARIRLWSVGGSEQEIAVEGSLMTIGRARDNDLVLEDARVSRHHARLQARSGSLVLTDLGSTNGTLVNGGRVHEVVLGDGDRIEIGDSVLVIEAGSGER